MTTATKTRIVIPSQNQDYSIPGVAMTIAQIQNAYGSEIPGLASLVGTESLSADGTERVITFTPRTGTKG